MGADDRWFDGKDQFISVQNGDEPDLAELPSCEDFGRPILQKASCWVNRETIQLSSSLQAPTTYAQVGKRPSEPSKSWSTSRWPSKEPFLGRRWLGRKEGRLEEAAPDDLDAAAVNTVHDDKALFQEKGDEAFNDEAVEEEEEDEEEPRC